MRNKYLLTLGVIIAVTTAQAQNTRISDHNSIGWYNTFISLKFSKKWSGYAEYQWRRDNTITDWQQSLLRTSVGYQLNNKLQLRAGFALIETFPYGDYPIQSAGKNYPERRLFEMATITDNVGFVELSHRFMLEQRWVGRYSSPALSKVDSYRFTNRLRYLLRAQIGLSKKKITDHTLYAAMYDEIFIGFGKNVTANVFDQNRFSALIGYRFNKTFRLEGGFFQQILELGRLVNDRNVFQYNNGVIVNTYINLDVSKHKKNIPGK